MALILSIETSTKNCSIALLEEDQLLFFKEESSDQYIHSEKLHVFLEELFLSSGKSKTSIDAIAVARGPGSYTGLRIGVSSAKGLCYAFDRPLLSDNSLKILAHQGKTTIGLEAGDIIISVLDARRMEVYCQVFDLELNPISKVEAKIIDTDSFSDLEAKRIHFVGDALEKIEAIASDERFVFHHEIKFPNAKALAELCQDKYKTQQFEDVAYFEPWYFKDFIAGKPKKLL